MAMGMGADWQVAAGPSTAVGSTGIVGSIQSLGRNVARWPSVRVSESSVSASRITSRQGKRPLSPPLIRSLARSSSITLTEQ